MASSKSNTFVVIGSGPGIGVSTANLFASRKFNKVALVSRDHVRLEKDRISVLAAAESAGRKVEVTTWSVDITETAKYQKALKDIENMGDITCVLFNAARVEPSQLFEFEEAEIMKDFMTTNIALYTTAEWALPILLRLSDNPSLLVTSSFLWSDPVPQMFSLSMVKAGQRTLVLSLQKTYPAIHIALLNVGGQVSKEDKFFNPDSIAKKYWELYSQEKSAWTKELDVLGQ